MSDSFRGSGPRPSGGINGEAAGVNEMLWGALTFPDLT